MKLSAILEPLVAAGVDAETILKTVIAYENQQENTLEKRRQADRDRQAKKRESDKMSRDVTLRHSDRQRSRSHVRVEDNNKTNILTGDNTSLASPATQPEKAKRGSRLPDDFHPDISEAVRLGLSEQDGQREADKFRDYWRGQPGQRGVKLDWQATWRNWCRSAVERKPHRKEPPPKPSTPRNAGEAAYLELQRNGTDDISPEFRQLLFGSDASRDRCEPDDAKIITLEAKRYAGF